MVGFQRKLMTKMDKHIIAGIIATFILYAGMVVLLDYATTKEPVKEVKYELN